MVPPKRATVSARPKRPKGQGTSAYPRVYAVVSAIPAGRVATYGQVAELAGMPRHARLVGYALHALDSDSDLPWHRVVNARGRISLRSGGDADQVQGRRLAREGVVFVRGSIPLERFRWTPRARPSPC